MSNNLPSYCEECETRKDYCTFFLCADARPAAPHFQQATFDLGQARDAYCRCSCSEIMGDYCKHRDKACEDLERFTEELIKTIKQ